MTSAMLRLASTPDPVSVEPLWTPEDLRRYLQCKSKRSFARVKKAFPLVQSVLPMQRYNPCVVRAIVAGDTPAKQHRVVRAAARRLG